ncbi:MAG TPA: transporter substrate-binding domain-containing protein [Geobacteraceae bacterium]
MRRATFPSREGGAAYRICRSLAILLATVSVLAFWAGPARAVPAGQGRATIVVGGDFNYPPYEFIDREGRPAGFNVELTRAIAEAMGLNVEIRLGPWGEMRKGLESGEVDILQGVVYTEERARTYDFSPPHAMVYQSIWTRKGEEIRSLQGLRGKEVIVMRSSVMHDLMLGTNLGAALVLTDSLAEALRLLSSGKHDCALVAKLPGQYLVKELGLTNIAPVAKPLLVQKYGYAVKKGNTELLNQFSEGLAILKRSGQFQAIHNKWLGVLEPPPISWQRVGRYVAMVALPLLLVLGGTVVWSRTLQQRVAQRTEELAREVAEKNRALEALRLHQDRLVQADKMASLGILVSGVAHEINNPNGLILLNLPLLAEAFRRAGPVLEAYYRENGDFSLGWHPYSRLREEIPTLFSETQEAAKRIKRIVEDLKDFARRDDALLTDAIDVNATVQAAVRLVDNAIRKATGHLVTDYAPDLPRVRGNAQRIEQVVVNLILNACQALEERGKGIFIATRHDRERDEVVLTVRDEGRGVAPEHLPHLTDPFFTTKREEGGTGLGLSVSAGIVKEHGGTLDFTPSPVEGVTVTLALPAMKENET